MQNTWSNKNIKESLVKLTGMLLCLHNLQFSAHDIHEIMFLKLLQLLKT